MAEMRAKGRRKMGQRSNDIVGKDADICSLFLYIYTQIKYIMAYYKSLIQNKLQVQY